MEVQEKSMYHYHKLGIYDDIWQVGNELIVDDNFNSCYGNIISNFNTTINLLPENKQISLDKIIEAYLENKEFTNLDEIKNLLQFSKNIIHNANIYNGELMLEKYRKDNNPNLPSRLHSIFLTDEKSLAFWKKQLREYRKIVLYRVSLTGNLFKSSDSFIPDDELTTKEMYEASSKYWNPEFKEEDLCKAEYLFQGKIKVLDKIDR